eukprot:Em0013g1110a
MEHKVVMLGQQACGKTSLVERYMKGTFRGGDYHSTIGAAFVTTKIDVGGKQVIMGIWDTAGTERYESMTRIYYRGASVAVVCFDLSEIKSFDRAKHWVDELRNCEENCKIYLCGTKLDLVKGDTWTHENIRHLANAYAIELNAIFVETSAATGENVASLFRQIAEVLIEAKERSMKHMTSSMVLEVEKTKTSSGCSC